MLARRWRNCDGWTILCLLSFFFCLLPPEASNRVVCRAQQEQDENATFSCTLCENGEATPILEKEINIEWPIITNASSCAELDVYAQSIGDEKSEECASLHSIGTLCGCPSARTEPCQLCGETGEITEPGKELAFLKADFNGTAVSCEIFEAYLRSSLDSNSTACLEAQVLVGGACGCPPKDDDDDDAYSCDLCRGQPLPDPDQESRILFFNGSEAWILEPFTCDLLVHVVAEVVSPRDCPFFQEEAAWACDCNVSDLQRRQRILLWCPRVAAIFSFLGSSFIIWDILWNRRRRGQPRASAAPTGDHTVVQHVTMQHLLLLCMSCIDVLSSTAWALSTLPMPEYDIDSGEPPWYGYYYGARGTFATCKAQAFFIQLGFASPMYNFSLAVYYLLVICYDWREDRIRKYRLYLLGLPFTVGLALAVAAFPFYGTSLTMCYVVEKEWAFLVIPIGFVMLFATLIMVRIFFHVYTQEQRVRQWRASTAAASAGTVIRNANGAHSGSGSGSRSSSRKSLVRRVFWQGFWYLMCFYVTWPVVFGVVFQDVGLFVNFGFACFAMFFAPLQGFLNFLAYSRLRWKSPSGCHSCTAGHEEDDHAAGTATAADHSTSHREVVDHHHEEPSNMRAVSLPAVNDTDTNTHSTPD